MCGFDGVFGVVVGDFSTKRGKWGGNGVIFDYGTDAKIVHRVGDAGVKSAAELVCNCEQNENYPIG